MPANRYYPIDVYAKAHNIATLQMRKHFPTDWRMCIDKVCAKGIHSSFSTMRKEAMKELKSLHPQEWELYRSTALHRAKDAYDRHRL